MFEGMIPSVMDQSVVCAAATEEHSICNIRTVA
jgi:hypothetical protein